MEGLADDLHVPQHAVHRGRVRPQHHRVRAAEQLAAVSGEYRHISGPNQPKPQRAQRRKHWLNRAPIDTAFARALISLSTDRRSTLAMAALNSSRSRVAIGIALAAGAAALYLPQLKAAPQSLLRDEVTSALTAWSLTSTGRDLNGRFLPLFFYPGAALDWSAPSVMVYAIAALLEVFPFSETTIRLPMALVGVIDVVLVYCVGLQLFKRVLLAVAAAVLTALTPAHFIFARLALPALLPVPFVLGWLLCVLVYCRNGKGRVLVTAGLLLVVASLSYFAFALLLPLYALLTCVVLYRRRERVGAYAAFLSGIVVPSTLVALWLAWNARAVGDFLAHYDWSRPGGSWTAQVAHVVSLYGSFWEPRFLFVDGPHRLEFSTRSVGIFLIAMAGPLVVGLLRTARRPLAGNALPGLIVVVGFVSAALPASLVGEPYAQWRALQILPFGVLLACLGLDLGVTARTGYARRAVLVACLSVTTLLAVVYHDYELGSQAMLRASLVPVALTALALLLSKNVVAETLPGRRGVAWC